MPLKKEKCGGEMNKAAQEIRGLKMCFSEGNNLPVQVTYFTEPGELLAWKTKDHYLTNGTNLTR